jgi:hypothetical protein
MDKIFFLIMKQILLKSFYLFLVVFIFSFFFSSCYKQRNEALQSKVDSLSIELELSQKVVMQLGQIDALMDSIDATRKVLRVNVVEGTSYKNYVNRLRELNAYIKETQIKIEELENTAKTVGGLHASIRKLKADLDFRTKEVSALKLEVARMRNANDSMALAIAQKDSTLLAKEEVIKVNEASIASIEASMRDINESNKIKMAELYYNQAKALEVVAERTNFAPRKKKEAMRDALELYKIALTLGKVEAQERIDVLEKELG